MGTIDENIAILKEHLKTLNIDNGVEFYQEIESIQSAIEIMRKYQRIQEIVKNTQQLCSYGSAFIDIRKVVENEVNRR